ncbi:MAG: glycosyltransferase, partial [Candidatus Omnitrophica bacterium]|nr:glycosyltransferase [Candidatus Omnitrophota bacterium]
MIDLSVIIVSWNVQDYLAACLESVYSGIKKFSFEIIIVDNNSSDGSAAMVKERFPAVVLIENRDNAGFSRANNQAVAVSTGEFILALNPDTLVLNDALGALLGFMRAHVDAGIAAPHIRDQEC